MPKGRMTVSQVQISYISTTSNRSRMLVYSHKLQLQRLMTKSDVNRCKTIGFQRLWERTNVTPIQVPCIRLQTHATHIPSPQSNHVSTAADDNIGSYLLQRGWSDDGSNRFVLVKVHTQNDEKVCTD